jgi:hypothetical protein
MKQIKKFESFGKDFKSFAKDLKSVSKKFIGIDEPYKGGILNWKLVNGEWTAQWRNYTFKISKESDQKDKRHKKWRLDFMNNHSCHSSWYDSINSASRDAMTFYVPMLLKSRNEDEEDYDGYDDDDENYDYPEEIDTDQY